MFNFELEYSLWKIEELSNIKQTNKKKPQKKKKKFLIKPLIKYKRATPIV